MKIFMTGGTGFVGSHLTEKLVGSGHSVTLLTRSVRAGKRLPAGAEFLEGDPVKAGPWQEKVLEHDAVINLAGASIFTVWTAKNRQMILDSRVLTTRNIVDALADASGRNIALISGSAVGYYGGRKDDMVLNEQSPPGNDFLTEVSLNWEGEAHRAENFGVRVVITRFGIVLGKGGGAFEKMLPAFKKCLGSSLGSGKQWFSWIHLEDLCNIIAFLLERNIAGPFNCTAPHPVTNKELTHTLADVLGCPVFMPPVPGFMLKALLGEFGDVVLKGQRVVPRRLLDEGFQFQFATLREALEDLTVK
ncbi:TIGR01777 family oxidoreductase [Desulfoferrobacter suflitae]|uniref:TIGR01777 family oxidoreductase n=1 Tax=Desulfoferrobacter suflitae TaxID=2865782 RepID=UPI002164F012|nr:TIGR01777 family oxidoreductase [Desulfoferrobacter suflitae]MCK8603352.1 TIGR01777 family oxidoreductase [Desulfoferrobacter suflitae]